MSIDWIPTGAARVIRAKEMGNRGIFPSNKVPGGIVEYESCLERDFFLICQHAPDVARFQHQPISIPYMGKDQKAKKYTPDAYVEFGGGKKALFEIKYEEEVLASRKKYEERWSAAREWGRERNIAFSVLTEQDIRTPRWFNTWFTLGSSKCTPSARNLEMLIQVIPENGERYVEICYQLAESAGMEINKSAQILCHAIYHGLVFVDSFSARQITNETVVRKRKGKAGPSFKPLWEELPNLGWAGGANETNAPFRKEVALESLSSRIPEKYEEKVLVKVKVAKAWLGQPKHRRTGDWRKKFCVEWGVSEKTAYNWAETYRKDGMGGLVPKHGRAGRRPMRDALAAELLEQSRQHFLAPLATLKNAYSMLEELCNERKIPVPKFSSFKKYIYNSTTASELAKKRGRKYHKAHFTPALASFQGALAPLQVVQMDNTSLDLFPVDSEARQGLPPPNLTAAIDCYTRMIAGVSSSFFPCSSQTVLDVLVQVILPKETYVNAYGTQQAWPIQGFPVLLLVDNGMDFRSQATRDFCVKYDLIIEYAPIRTPRFKAFVEQWFNALRNALAGEGVPGARPLLKHRIENPELKPEAGAVLTLQEIEEWLHKWVLDEYHFTNPYDDHAPAPHLRWQDFQGGRTSVLLPLPREAPADPLEIDLLHLSTLQRAEKMLSYEGVTWHYLKYNNKELAGTYNQLGRQKVEVLLNPRDIRCVWVVAPGLPRPIKVGLSSGWAQAIAKQHGDRPIHASAWDKDVRILKERLKERISPFLYQKEASRMARDALVKAAGKSTKTTRKQSEQSREAERKSIATNVRQNHDTQPADGKPSVQASRKGEDELGDGVVEPYPTEWEVVKKKMTYWDLGTDDGEKGG